MLAQTASPADLQYRARYRRELVKEIIYDSTPLFEGGEAIDQVLGSQGVHTYAITLVAGVHMPVDAIDLTDLYPEAAAVVSTLANAMQHIQNGGKSRSRLPVPKGTLHGSLVNLNLTNPRHKGTFYIG
jgi:hypothetical protein